MRDKLQINDNMNNILNVVNYILEDINFHTYILESDKFVLGKISGLHITPDDHVIKETDAGKIY